MKTIEFKDSRYIDKTNCKPEETSNAPAVADRNNNSAQLIFMFPKEKIENDITRNRVLVSANDRFFKFNKFFYEGVLMDHVLLLYNCCS
jgi:hypothetical protein